MSDEIRGNLRDKLDPKVMAAALIVGVIEFELFTDPKGMADFAQQDAWLSILLGGLISTIATYLLVRLASRFPGENLFQYNKKIWGRPVAFAIVMGYLLYWTVYLTLLFKDFSTANKILFLRETPSLVPMLILAAGAALLVSYGLPAVIRFFQLMLPFLILPLLLIIILAIRRVELEQFLPVLSNGILPVLKGAVYFAGVLQGVEIILFLSPFLTDVKKATKPALIGINSINLLALIFAVIPIGIMGNENIKESLWPVINTISLIELPGFPVERFELFLTLPWLIGIFTTMCLFIYLLSFGIIQVFNLRNRKLVVFSVAGLIVLATYILPNYTWALTVREHFFIPSLLFLYVIPLLTLLISILRAKRD